MPIESVPFTTKEAWLLARAEDVTSSEVSALFGLNPYLTAFELWHRKKQGLATESELSEWSKWGTRLQDSIAHGIAEDEGWAIKPKTEYIRDRELRMGASFDYEVQIPAGLGAEWPIGILEIKNVFGIVYKKEWFEDEAPPHIELQLQQQLALSGASFGYIGALVSGNKIVLLKRTPDETIIRIIKSKINEFWRSIEEGEAPKPDFEKDSDAIQALFSHAEPGKVFDGRADETLKALTDTYKRASDEEKKLKKEKDSVKAKILMLIGDAEKALGTDFSISAGLVGPCHVEYDREGYRQFKISWRKNENLGA